MGLPSLYSLTDDFNKLMDIEDPNEFELSLLATIAGDIETKAENICKLVKQFELTAESFKAEEKRISERRKALENHADRIKRYMKESLTFANIDKVQAGTFSVSIRPSQGSLQIEDMAAIPAEYIKVVYEPDKAKIKDAIKNGAAIPGAHIEAGTTLTIR